MNISMPRRMRWALAAGAALAVSLAANASPCTKPDALTPDGGRYCGPLEGGRMHGRGVLEWDNGERYEGEFADGRYSGTGRLRFGSGETYEGEFRAGLMDGRGRMTLVDGAVYTGEFRKDYFNGQGRLETLQGEVYEGAFKNGHYHGHGRLTDAAGIYEGEFKDGMHWGEGVLTYEDGGKYAGSFERGRFHGQGRFRGESGETYEGTFRNGQLAGHGRKSLKDGSRYEGEFKDWRFHGKGMYTDSAGNLYDGRFNDGVFEGTGRFVAKNGVVYEGEFKSWRSHGQGVQTEANGDTYKGGFAYGVYEGEGTLTYAKPRPDGRTQVEGTWRYGTLDKPEERARALANVETALYGQRHLLDRALASVARQDPKRIDLYLLAIAGDGTQEVFRREVEYVREQFAQRFGTRARTVTLVNSRHTVGTLPMATNTSIREALKAIAARMDRRNDILFLFLTSHGSKEHELSLNLAGLGLAGLTAAKLGELLEASGIRWKVVVVSACYGGGFVDAIRNDRTLVITAARRDRQSFGCADENDFTYFGRAYFKEALPQSGSFQDAFGKAEALVRRWELEHAVAPAAAAPGAKPEEPLSLPQLHSGELIDRHLQRFWAQFRR
jgi:hypothetical protein